MILFTIYFPIYYYPPPTLRYILKAIQLLSTTFFWCIAQVTIFRVQLVLLLIPAIVLLVGHKKPPDPTKVLPEEPRGFVDCSVILPAHFLVFSALQVRPAFKYFFDHYFIMLRYLMWCDAISSFPVTTVELIYGTYTLLLYGLCHYVDDGVNVYRILPWYIYLPRELLRSRGRIYLAIYRIILQQGRNLCPTRHHFTVEHIKSRYIRLTRAIRRINNISSKLFLTTLCISYWGIHNFLAYPGCYKLFTFHPNSELPAFMQAYKRQAYTLAFTADDEQALPQSEMFEKGSFFVLLDNCANCTIATDRRDFTSFRPSDGQINGVGAAAVKGEGTVHWQLISDTGKPIDIIIDNALYVPTMDYRIVSV